MFHDHSRSPTRENNGFFNMPAIQEKCRKFCDKYDDCSDCPFGAKTGENCLIAAVAEQKSGSLELIGAILGT